jgi:hypothetical protein
MPPGLTTGGEEALRDLDRGSSRRLLAVVHTETIEGTGEEVGYLLLSKSKLPLAPPFS